MKNKIQPGKTITFTAAADVESGAGILLGDQGLFGVSSTAVTSGEEGEAELEGVFELPMAAVTVDAFDVAYWDDGNSLVTNSASGNTKIGYFTKAAASGAGSCEVNIRPVL